MKSLRPTTALLLLTIYTGAIAPCPEGINLMPKYGRVKKCKAQLKLDEELITQAKQEHGSRQKGAEKFVDLGWEYLSRNQTDIAMKRFNQAWLLDSLNRQVDWGFGTTLRMQGKNKASLSFLR